MGRSSQEMKAALQERINGLDSQALPDDTKLATGGSSGFGSFASGVLFVQGRPESPPEHLIKREPKLHPLDSQTAPNSPRYLQSPVFPAAVSVPVARQKKVFLRSRSRSCGSLMEMLGEEPVHTGDAEVQHFGELRFRKHAVAQAIEP